MSTVKTLRRKATLFGRVLYWSANTVLVLGLAFMVHPEGYAKARHYRDTHVVVSLSESSAIRDLAKNLTSYDFDQVKCLAVNSYFEARGEGDLGMEAVDDVVLNRAYGPEHDTKGIDRAYENKGAASSRYPDGVCQVVYQGKLDPGGTPSLNRCQFSWYCDGRDHTIKDHEVYQRAYEIAYNKYLYRSHGLMSDKTSGATHYHADYVSPHWPWARLSQLGHHIFYR